MATMLNGILPARKKDQYNRDRSFSNRWGDAAISAPMHAGWNTSSSQSQSSPDLDRDLPPTPPQSHEEDEDGVFIVPDEDDEARSGDEVVVPDRENVTITIPLPWKKKTKGSHGRKLSQTPVNAVNPRFAAPRRIDVMTPPPPPPPPGAVEPAMTVPLPESRVSSPLSRSATTSPAMSFRARLATPGLADILSPVAEGFAKDGHAVRPAPFVPMMQATQYEPIERVSSSTSIRSNMGRRTPFGTNGAEGLGGATMSSQATTAEQLPEFNRPPSRGIGATAHMRASSRGPRPPRAASVEPMQHHRVPLMDQYSRRAPSVDPYSRRAPSVEPYYGRAPSVEPVGRRAPSVEPLFRRVEGGFQPFIPAPLDLEPLRSRAPSVEPGRRRAPSIDPASRRAPSVEPHRQREPSVGPGERRAPSVGPGEGRRAASREPRGRRGISVEPRQRIRFHSEAAHRSRRQDYAYDDGSSDSDRARDDSEQERMSRRVRFDGEVDAGRRPRRRRSIASPIASPITAAFDIAQISSASPPPPPLPPLQPQHFDTIDSRAGLERQVAAPMEPRAPSRNKTPSQGRGLYADMQNDFRELAREVQKTNSPPPVTEPTHIITQLPRGALNNPSRTASPMVVTDPSPYKVGVGSVTSHYAVPDHNRYSPDNSMKHSVPAAIPLDGENEEDSSSGRARLTAVARERKDQLRREEREKAREKVARKLERERERVVAINALSDCDSLNNVKGTDLSRQIHHVDLNSGLPAQRGKTLVPDAEDIWG